METRAERNRRVVGVLVLIPAAVAVAIAAWTGLEVAPWVGAGYLGVAAIAGVTVLWAFCARCPCAGHGCGHVVPGWIVGALLPRRPQGRYSTLELGLTAVALALLLALPLVWLWRSPLALGAFLVLLAAAAVPIRLVVCRGCGNAHCPAA